MGAILNHFNNQDNLDRYNLQEVTRYDVYYAQFLHNNKTDTFYLRGRSVEPNEKILQSVFKDIKGNVIAEHGSFNQIPCGIIVTLDFLKTLGYEGTEKSILKVYMPYENDVVLVDVLAVVKELPSFCDFLSSPILPNMRNLPTYETGFVDEERSNIIPILVSGKLTTEEIGTWEESSGSTGLSRITEIGPIEIVKDQPGMLYRFVFPLNGELSDQTLKSVTGHCPGGKKAVLYKETFCNDKFSSVEAPDHLAFQFRSLNEVRAFKDGMLKDFEVTVSMQQIESAENFSLVSTLTLTTSIVLFGFSLLSIGFYISSLIHSHLQKISSNLGTMKAFGLKNKVLARVYVTIIGVFCVISSILALMLAIGIQLSLVKLHMKFDLNVLNSKVIFALAIIFLLCMYLAYRSTRIILKNTPGDLIYKRNK
ncbi:MAG: ABC transporter permease [Saprospiraceae bacterium]